MSGILIQKPCYYGGKDQSYMSTGQETPKSLTITRRQEEVMQQIVPQAPERTTLANTIDFRFTASRNVGEYIPVV